MLQNLKKSLIFGVFMACSFILVGCGDTDSQDLRSKFESQLESGFSVMMPLIDAENRLPKDAPKCLAKAASQTFSDEEIRLIIDSSFSERLQNAERIMAIQQKMESPQFVLRFLKNCGY